MLKIKFRLPARLKDLHAAHLPMVFSHIQPLHPHHAGVFWGS
jgi:hypothetical protein